VKSNPTVISTRGWVRRELRELPLWRLAFWASPLFPRFCWLKAARVDIWLIKLRASELSEPTNWPGCRVPRTKRSLPVICPAVLSPRDVAPATPPPAPIPTPPNPAGIPLAPVPPKPLLRGVKLEPIERLPNAPLED